MPNDYMRAIGLLLGFAALPIRAVRFAISDNPLAIVCYQVLDGVSASVIGVMLPLVVADITRRGGRFNLGMGIVGLAVALGATLSNAVGGAIANQLGQMPAFSAFAVAGLAAFLLVWYRMPNTATEPGSENRSAEKWSGYDQATP